MYLSTYCCYDDNDNGFMAALSRLKHKMQYDLIYDAPRYNTILALVGVLKEMGILPGPPKCPVRVRRKFSFGVSPILFLN